MSLSRRELIKLAPLAILFGLAPERLFASTDEAVEKLYAMPPTGDFRLIHITDVHGQLLPVHYREPNVNIGVGVAFGRPPHLVGQALLKQFGIPEGGRRAHALTYLDYVAGTRRYGRMGGFAHIKTLIDRLRGEAKASLLMDGGDTWQGSATALWTKGADMVEAANRLGVDCMTGHWEFTYPADVIRKNIAALKADFLAANVFLSDDAAFSGAKAYDDAGHAFKPYAIKTLNGQRVAVIGQAFPHVHVAHPSHFTPDWSYGIHDQELQTLVDTIRDKEKPALVVLLSHNGMDTDLKLAGKVSGIDIIFGGHTHDALPAPSLVENGKGKTLVTNAGTNGKFVGVVDVEIAAGGGLKRWNYRLMPVFSELLPAAPGMAKWIADLRAPYAKKLSEPLGTAESLLYRRGNFNGTMDQLICNALRKVLGADLSFSPGFRWGTSVPPGEHLTFEDVMQETSITYPNTYVSTMTGAQIKATMEDVCDNLFNPDAYRQQGGDMVRVGGLNYTCDPGEKIGARLTALRLDNGKPLEADKQYKVAGWAAVNTEPTGAPVWDVVANYLRSDRHATRIDRLNQPRLRNVKNNPGLADYDTSM
ncbi:MAG: thiosulfohydrolase SoxB [Nevskiaceae bacterium]|nr:MAG: thiosulfohydrolase SoxB [Nevskiaceae bacterium]TBR73041.1 MAG: thiosulfohydrolase SoxB [Nevskiaceae bacterium]